MNADRALWWLACMDASPLPDPDSPDHAITTWHAEARRRRAAYRVRAVGTTAADAMSRALKTGTAHRDQDAADVPRTWRRTPYGAVWLDTPH